MDGGRLARIRTASVFVTLGAMLAWGAYGAREAPRHHPLAEAPEHGGAHAQGHPAEESTDLQHAAEEMAQSAINFWNALTPEQQAKAHYDMKDEERYDWHFIPKPRKGLPLREMTAEQRQLAHAFLASGLSRRGYQQAVTIMSLDEILKEMEKGKGPLRDPDGYFFTVFGTPGANQTWGWRVEGHHLSLNFTIADGKAAVAGPTFMGSNPGEVREGPRKGLRVLGETEDVGRKLVKSLNDEQRKVAVFSEEAPKEIITGNSRKADLLSPPGLAAEKMTAEQRAELTDLVKLFAHRLRAELAAEDLEKIEKAGWDKVHFAWAGGLEPGQKHYYRIQGPTFLVEYDNTQNDANHIHTVWRDAGNDFGEDILKRHYEEHHADAR